MYHLLYHLVDVIVTKKLSTLDTPEVPSPPLTQSVRSSMAVSCVGGVFYQGVTIRVT